jgi:DNA-binding NarL/FixJ family response regulator
VFLNRLDAVFLIADAQEVVRHGLRKILERQPNWKVVAEASDAKDAISKVIETKPDVAVLRLRDAAGAGHP